MLNDETENASLARTLWAHIRPLGDSGKDSTQRRLCQPPSTRSSPHRTVQSVSRTRPIHGNVGAKCFCVGNANQPHAQTSLVVSIH